MFQIVPASDLRPGEVVLPWIDVAVLKPTGPGGWKPKYRCTAGGHRETVEMRDEHARYANTPSQQANMLYNALAAQFRMWIWRFDLRCGFLQGGDMQAKDLRRYVSVLPGITQSMVDAGLASHRRGKQWVPKPMTAFPEGAAKLKHASDGTRVVMRMNLAVYGMGLSPVLLGEQVAKVNTGYCDHPGQMARLRKLRLIATDQYRPVTSVRRIPTGTDTPWLAAGVTPEFVAFLNANKGLVRLKTEPSIYHRVIIGANGPDSRDRLIVHVHVDDGQVGGTDPGHVAHYKAHMQYHFDVKTTGGCPGAKEAHLGWEVQQSLDRTRITVTGDSYISKALEVAGLKGCKPVRTPATAGSHPEDVPASVVQSEELKAFPYRAMVGILLWAAVLFSSLQVAASWLGSRSNDNWTVNDVQRVKRALRWLAGQIGRGRQFNHDPDVDMRSWLRIYCDASFADELATSKSTSGFFIAIVGPNTFMPINSFAKKQVAVSHPTTESEMVSLEEGLRTEALQVLTFREHVVQIFSPANGNTGGGLAAAASGANFVGGYANV